MATDPCPVCGSTDRRQVVCDLSDARQIVACPCGLQSIFPFPEKEELDALYQSGYYDFWTSEGDFQDIFNVKLKTCRRLIRQARPAISAESADRQHLDIGSAFGYMMEAAQGEGYRSQGIEISPAAEAAAHRGYHVLKVPLEKAALPKEYFDLITAVDVIEHIPDPKQWLLECRRILKKEGVLLIVTPDCSSLPARVRKSKWPHYKPEHLYYYTPRLLSRLFSKAGFHEIGSTIGRRYLTLHYVIRHYEKFQPRSLETRMLRVMKKCLPLKLLELPLCFPSERVYLAKKT